MFWARSIRSGLKSCAMVCSSSRNRAVDAFWTPACLLTSGERGQGLHGVAQRAPTRSSSSAPASPPSKSTKALLDADFVACVAGEPPCVLVALARRIGRRRAGGRDGPWARPTDSSHARDGRPGGGRCAEVRRRDAGHSPVAFRSGTAAEANQLVRAGGIGFIPKPFEPGTLPELVAQFLRATVARDRRPRRATAEEPSRDRLLIPDVHPKLSGFANQAWARFAPEPQVAENLRSGPPAKSGIVWHSPCFTASQGEAWNSGARSGLGRAAGDESRLRLVSKRGATGHPGRAGAARRSR